MCSRQTTEKKKRDFEGFLDDWLKGIESSSSPFSVPLFFFCHTPHSTPTIMMANAAAYVLAAMLMMLVASVATGYQSQRTPRWNSKQQPPRRRASLSDKVVAPPLRERQETIVSTVVDTLNSTNRGFIVAPTGYGKTAIFSNIIARVAMQVAANASRPAKVLVLNQKTELVAQNEGAFNTWAAASSGLSTGRVGGGSKDYSSDIIFGTVQSCCRPSFLSSVPTVDLLVVDEAHHVAAPSYRKIITHYMEGNPDLKILGVTATPLRGDRRSFTRIFPNVTYQVTLAEGYDEGVLVKPIFRTLDAFRGSTAATLQRSILDLEVDKNVGQKDEKFAKLVNGMDVNQAVVQSWRVEAGDRQTVVFCSTVAHARNVEAAFRAVGVKTGCVVGEMTSGQKEKVLRAFARQDIQVIVNVFVLTEGWDDPATACVVLLRPSSVLSSWRQMIGRGMRCHGSEKKDCLVLDFGVSTMLHKDEPEVTQLDADPWDFAVGAAGGGGEDEEEEEKDDDVYSHLRLNDVYDDHGFPSTFPYLSVTAQPTTFPGGGGGVEWLLTALVPGADDAAVRDDADFVATAIKGFVAVLRPYEGVDLWVGVCPVDDDVKACEVIAYSQDRNDCLITSLELVSKRFDGFKTGYIMRKQNREAASGPQREWLRNKKCVQMADAPVLSKYEAAILLKLAFEGHKIVAAVDAKLKDAPGIEARRRPLWTRGGVVVKGGLLAAEAEAARGRAEKRAEEAAAAARRRAEEEEALARLNAEIPWTGL
jgi:superfamily II DNA or RNA helicase